MSLHAGVWRLGILFGAVIMLLTASQAYARGFSQVQWQAIQSQHYQVSGQVRQIASSQDYPHTVDARFFNVTQDAQGLIDVSYFVVGVPAHFSVKKPSNNEEVRAVEVAVTPKAHTQLIMVGVLGAVSSSPSATGYLSQLPLQAERTYSSGCTSTSGWDRATWEDPVGITVNYVQNTVDWCYDGQTIHPFWSAWPNTWENQGTGWKEDWGGFNAFVAQGGSIWGEANTVDRFINPHFAYVCDETDTYYTPWTLVFWNDGSIAWSGSTYDSGTCSSLLHWVLTLQ